MANTDLDNPAAIGRLVDAFYARVLTDPTLAPVFTEVAGIELEHHLPRIKAFWCKMILGQAGYRRNMVAKHAAVHARFPLGQRHFDRWLALFTRTLDERFAGPCATRARYLAVTIAANLARNLDVYTRCTSAGGDDAVPCRGNGEPAAGTPPAHGPRRPEPEPDREGVSTPQPDRAKAGAMSILG